MAEHTQTVDSKVSSHGTQKHTRTIKANIYKTAVDYLDPTNEPEPSEVTGVNNHFNNTFDPAMKKDAPQIPHTSIAPAPKSAQEKLASTDSTMTTAQLQAAARDDDPNGLQPKVKK